MQHFWSHHFTACNIQDHYVAFNLVLKSNLQSLLIKAHRCAEHFPEYLLRAICSCVQLPQWSFQQTHGMVRLFWEPREHKEQGPTLYPCFDPSIQWSPMLYPHPLCPSLRLPGWLVCWVVPCTWHSSRRSLLTKEQIGVECTWWPYPNSSNLRPLPFFSFSLSLFRQWQSLSPSL